MASPKSGKAGSLVEPKAPKVAEDADDADPGTVEKLKARQKESGSGKYGKVEPKQAKPSEDKEEKKTWIAVKLKDENDNPIPGKAFVVKDGDGAEVKSGTLDDQGKARVEGIKPGNYKIEFPDIDKTLGEKV